MDSAKSFDARFERIMQATKVSKEADLAKILGINQSSIHAAKKRQQIPTGWVELVAEEFSVNANWLFFGKGTMESTSLETQHGTGESDFIYIPKVEARLAAGTGSLETSADVVAEYAFRADWILRKGNVNKMVLMDVSGESMEPEIKDGDMVLIDQSKTDIYANKVYAIGVDDTIFIKEIDKTPGILILRSFNPRYKDIEVDLSVIDQPSVRVIGRVIWVCREY